MWGDRGSVLLVLVLFGQGVMAFGLAFGMLSVGFSLRTKGFYEDFWHRACYRKGTGQAGIFQDVES